LSVAQRVDRVGQDLGIGEETLADDLAAEHGRRCEEQQRGRQQRPDDSAHQGCAEAVSRPRRRIGLIH